MWLKLAVLHHFAFVCINGGRRETQHSTKHSHIVTVYLCVQHSVSVWLAHCASKEALIINQYTQKKKKIVETGIRGSYGLRFFQRKSYTEQRFYT